MKTNNFDYAFFQNKFVEIEDAKVSIMTNALQYATAIFGGIRGYYNKEKGFISVFRLADHYKRFLSSTKILGVRFPYSNSELEKITIDLIQKNVPNVNIYLRPFAYIGHTNLTPSLANAVMDFALYMIPLNEYLPVSKGLNVCVSSWRRISDNAIPSRGKFSGAYINSALARKEANDGKFDEAIMLSESGSVSEGSAENVFIVRDGVLITPTASDDILEGITRKSIIQIAQDLKIPTEVRTVDRSELYIADEAFFSGTGVQIAWIKTIDRRTVGTGQIGRITAMLQENFFNIVRGEADTYMHWCTKVPIEKTNNI